MSPAIVDFRTPGAASPQAHPRQSPPPNPGKGQIPGTPPSFSFDPTGIRPTDLPSAATSARPMDRANLGHSFPGSGNSTDGGLHDDFASPAPFFRPSAFPSVSAAGKPSPAVGLSKPRFVKMRKHFASSRVRPTVSPEVGDAFGLNPFRAEPAVSAAGAADQKGGGGMRGLNEKLHSWKHFGSEAGIMVPEYSGGPNLCSFESVNSESVGFVFGAGSTLKQGANIGSENVKDRAFSFVSEGSRGPNAGLFVFESGAKKSSDSGRSSPENLSGTKLGIFESVKSESSSFVFGTGSDLKPSVDIGSETVKDRVLSSGSAGSRGPNAGLFVFGSGVKKSSESGRSSQENLSGTNMGSFDSVKAESSSFVFVAGSALKPSVDIGSETVKDRAFNFGSEGSQCSDAGVFVFGSGVKKNSESGQSSQENLSGINLGSFESVKSESSSFVFVAGSALKPSVDIGSETVKDCAFNFGSEGSQGSNAGVFVFGSGVKKNSESGQSSQENLSGTNVGSSDSVKSEISGFVFGAGPAANQSAKNVVSGNNIDCTYSFGSEGSGGSETSVFVSGSSVKKSSDFEQNTPETSSSLNRGNFESVKSESADFVFGASSVSNLKKPDHTCNFANKESSNYHSGAFVPGNGVEKSSNPSQNLSGNLTGSNMGSFTTGNSESTTFVFDGYCGSFSDANSVGSGSAVRAASGMVKNRKGKSDSSVFVFGSGTQNGVSSSRNLPENSNIPNLGTYESGNSKNANFNFGASSASSLRSKRMGSGNTLGGEFSFTSERSWNADTDAFVFGSGMGKFSNLSQSSSIVSEEVPFSRLPNEMRKLNLQSSGNEGFEKTKQANNKAMVDRGNAFVFGGNQNASSSISEGAVNLLPEQMKPLNIGNETASKSTKIESADQTTNVFVFGSNMKKSSPSNLRSTNSLTSFEKSTFPELPNDIQKLNVEGSFTPTFIGGAAVNMLPEEVKLESGTASKNTKIESTDQTSKVFVSGSNMKKSSASSQRSTNSFTSFEKCTCSELPNDAQKLNIEGLRNGGSFTESKHANHQFKVDVNNGPNGFTFPSNKDASDSFEGNGVNTLHNDMQKLNINKPENSTANIDLGDCLASFKFTFHAGKLDANSTTGHVPSSRAEEHFTFSGVAAPSFNPSSSGPGFQFVGTEFTFRSMHAGQETPYMEIRTHKQGDSGLPKENLFTGPHHAMAFNMMKGEVRSTKTKKRRAKSRQSFPAHHTFAKPFISTQKGSLENMDAESAGGCSPMDYSPYRENLVADQYSREASVASDESRRIFSHCASTDTHSSFSVDEREDLISTTQGLKHDANGSKSHVERSFSAKSSIIDEQNSGPGGESFVFKSDSAGLSSDNNNAAMEADTGPFISHIEMQATEGGTCFTFATSSEDFGGSNFKLSASPFAQGPLSAAKRHYRRKNRMKTGQDLYNSTPNASVSLAPPSPNLFPLTSTTVQPDSAQDIEDMPSSCQFADGKKEETNGQPDLHKEAITKEAANVAAQEACEKWRFRGNKAYANGYLSKAEEYYTRGVNSLSPNETSRNCSRALMLCYSNRAAARMSLGRMREALNDCMIAVAIDPSFLRAHVRAANCHLALGEIEDALKRFKKCLQSDDGARSDQKILVEASEGVQKAQLVSDYIVQSEALIQKRTPDELTKALQLISEAMSISPYSENLMEMKAEALLMLRNYEEVIQFCEQSLDSAERKSFLAGSDDQLNNVDSSGNMKISSVRLWRWRLISKSYFYLGKLEDALELLRKHEQVKPTVDRYGNKSSENYTSFSVTIRKLLRLKAAGNEAFQAVRHLEAVEHYTAALACNTESRPFAAICFCNRAAAYQALHQITDAIADCSLAIALDASYPKAISRRATLHEMIRDYGQAAIDLRRLVSLLEKQLTNKGKQSGSLGKSTSNDNDLNRARLRLSSVEAAARRETPLDMYMILGIEPSSSAADVKKAYRKAALRHHPDKAGQFLARSENADDGLWREVADEVYMDADRLFKMIGEAYAVLSDPEKRLQYDAEEEIRTMKKKSYNMGSTPKTSADNYSSQYEKSSNRHRWQ